MSQANGQSVQSDVLDAVVAALGGKAAGAYRCRFRGFAATELPADNVLPDDSASAQRLTLQTERSFRFRVRSIAAQGEGADLLADARYVRGALLLLADPTLGGLVTSLREIDQKWEMENAEAPVVAAVTTYEAQFSTSRADPRVRGL